MNQPKRTLSIREMAETDIGQVAKLEAYLGATNWNLDLFEGEFKLNDNQRHWLVVLAGNEIIGFGGISFAANESHILNVGVSPQHQREGVGTSLLQALLEKAFELGATTVLLEVESTNQPAICLYQSFGMSTIGERRNYYGASRHATTMKLEL